MKTITIDLNYTLADLEEMEGLDFGYDCDNPDKWLVVCWHRSWEGDVVSATCCTDENNNLFTFHGVNN